MADEKLEITGAGPLKIACRKEKMKMNRKLWYCRPALEWVEALPVGNGRIGAMVYSNPCDDIVQINEDTLWTGYPNRETRKHDMCEVQKIRSLIKSGKYYEATQATSDSMLNIRSEKYLPYGDLHIDIAGSESKIENYRRELDMSTGIVKAEYMHNGGMIWKETFVSLKDDVLVIHIKSKQHKILHVYQSVFTDHKINTNGNVMQVTGHCPTNNHMEYEDGKESVHYCSMLQARINEDDGYFLSGGNSMSIIDPHEVTFVFAIKTSFNGYDKMPVSEGAEYMEACKKTIADAAQFSYEELRERHIKEYKKYFDRVELEIDGENPEQIPTDERIKNAAAGAADNGLVTLLFDYARYLMITGSAEGTQPMNLQGIWNSSMFPPWNCNYTMNINTQMNYWAVETCNLPECHMPFLNMIRELSEKGNNFGLNGWSSWHNSDLWRFNYEATNGVLWGYWQMGGFWSVRHIWEHYLHTRDKHFLEEYYPILCGAADFLSEWMCENDEGYLVTCPSTSPENEFYYDGKRCAVCEGSAMDMSIIYDLFDKLIKASEVLECDCAKYKHIFDRLAPIKTGADGRILEWGREFEETELAHRHISHLYGLFPSDIWSGRPDYIAAAEKSLKVRLDNGGGGTGWSNAWIANVYARLKNGERVMHHIRHMFQKSIYPNMFDAHPPFQIDGNFGICSAICEALMQSHTGKIELLPALPPEWKSGTVKGFVTRTGDVIDFKWKDGEAYEVNIRALGKQEEKG